MIIVLKPNSTIEDIAHVEQMVTVRGLDTHVVHGTDMHNHRLYRRHQ